MFSYDFGFGAFHSGVEVNSVEHTFAGNESSSSGIVRHPPKQVPSARFRISIDMGETSKSSSEIEAEVRWRGGWQRDIHFRGKLQSFLGRNLPMLNSVPAERWQAFCQALVGRRIPGWINR
eukprot:752016-Hanusia_phi.AAC.1